MKDAPLRIVIAEEFAQELKSELKLPYEISTIAGQADTEIRDLLAHSDVFVSGEFKASWRADESRLRLLHTVGAGVDGIDFDGLPQGCTVCNVYGHERGVTEQAVMLMLALQKELLRHDRALRQGDWKTENPYISELSNRNLLILGLGHIGAELVRWGRFLHMNVTALTRTPQKTRGDDLGEVTVGALSELGNYLPNADFVVIAIPATPETENLMGAAELGQMKPSAYLINVGRAAVVNEEALYAALKTRSIAGAGLDVWYRYPASLTEKCLPAHLPFHELNNVIMTPHKPTVETMQYRWRKIADNIHRFAEGKALDNVVRSV